MQFVEGFLKATEYYHFFSWTMDPTICCNIYFQLMDPNETNIPQSTTWELLIPEQPDMPFLNNSIPIWYLRKC